MSQWARENPDEMAEIASLPRNKQDEAIADRVIETLDAELLKARRERAWAETAEEFRRKNRTSNL